MKEKLWKKCGTSVNSMQLELYDDCKNKLCDLSDDSRPLGFYSPLDGLVFCQFPLLFLLLTLILSIYILKHINYCLLIPSFYGKRFRIHIIDLDPSSVTSGGWLEDTSLVEKYSISEDEYNKRSGKLVIYL